MKVKRTLELLENRLENAKKTHPNNTEMHKSIQFKIDVLKNNKTVVKDDSL